MQSFKEFFTESTESDVRDTLKKLPKKHAALLKGYKYQWQCGNELKDDDEHIGIINPKNKTVTICCPWRYSRQWVLLHEIAHCVWKLLTNDQKEKWKNIVNKTKHKLNQNREELFCMAYSNYFSERKVVIHDHESWNQFIKSICKG